MASLTFDNPKDPIDVAPYSFGWVEYSVDDVTQVADPLTTCNIAVINGDDSLIIVSQDVIGDYAVAMLSGGTAGTTYVIECTATFESGKILNRSAKLKVKDL